MLEQSTPRIRIITPISKQSKYRIIATPFGILARIYTFEKVLLKFAHLGAKDKTKPDDDSTVDTKPPGSARSVSSGNRTPPEEFGFAGAGRKRAEWFRNYELRTELSRTEPKMIEPNRTEPNVQGKGTERWCAAEPWNTLKISLSLTGHGQYWHGITA